MSWTNPPDHRLRSPLGWPASSMDCSATYGIGVMASTTGRTLSCSGAMNASPSSRSPNHAGITAIIGVPTRSPGTIGAGGGSRNAAAPAKLSSPASCSSRRIASTSGAADTG
jgi:hypothetical protein